MQLIISIDEWQWPGAAHLRDNYTFIYYLCDYFPGISS